MPSTNFFYDKRRSSRKRSRMGHQYDDNSGIGSNINEVARFLQNPYDDYDEYCNERLIEVIEAENPMRESLEEDELVDEYLAQVEHKRKLSIQQQQEANNRLLESSLASSTANNITSNNQQQQQQQQQATVIEPTKRQIKFAVLPTGKFDRVFEAAIKLELKTILNNHCKSEQIDCNDKSIYTGLPGISLLYHHLSTRCANYLDSKTLEEISSKAAQQLNQYLISIQLPHMHNSKCPSFHCGDLGVYTFCTIARSQQKIHRELLTRTLSYPGPRTALSQSAPSNTTSLLASCVTSCNEQHDTATTTTTTTATTTNNNNNNTATTINNSNAPTITAHNQHLQNHSTAMHHNFNIEQISNEPETSILIEKILELVRMQETSGTPDELLYGRTGGLYAMLLIKQQLPKQTIIKDEHIANHIQTIFHSGKSMESFGRPLFYSWHGKEYVGAAHGYSGILYMLLEAYKYLNDDQLKLLRNAINFVESVRYESCNYPSSIGGQTDRLVHWCHGAPGVVHMLIKAYQVYKEDCLLESALACGDVIWKRGLLRKGFGLCHGISGNAYAFLHLYQVTRNLKHLYRAGKFAQFYLENRDKISWRADSPASLFEGYAGLAFFFADLLNAAEAKFPAFQLTASSPVHAT